MTRSVNLVFIRLMRDLVRHYVSGTPGSARSLLEDPADPRRERYLARFADKEGRAFLGRFHVKYSGRSPQENEALLLRGMRASPTRLAALLSALEPEAGIDGLQAFLGRRSTGGGLSERSARGLYDKYGPRAAHPERSRLCRRRASAGAVAGRIPASSSTGVLGRSSARQLRPTAGGLWLAAHEPAKACTGCAHRQHAGIGSLGEIQRAWQKLGYPFEALTPSYATAIGASGDRPSALAELMGIAS